MRQFANQVSSLVRRLFMVLLLYCCPYPTGCHLRGAVVVLAAEGKKWLRYGEAAVSRRRVPGRAAVYGRRKKQSTPSPMETGYYFVF